VKLKNSIYHIIEQKIDEESIHGNHVQSIG